MKRCHEKHTNFHFFQFFFFKVLLQRSSGLEGTYVSVAEGCYAYDIFLITWGPTIAALSYIYDHADDKTITKKAISGFRCVGTRWGRGKGAVVCVTYLAMDREKLCTAARV